MWTQLASSLLQFAAEKASPEIRSQLKAKLDDWEKDAKATPNPFDDVLVYAVRIILNL